MNNYYRGTAINILDRRNHNHRSDPDTKKSVENLKTVTKFSLISGPANNGCTTVENGKELDGLVFFVCTVRRSCLPDSVRSPVIGVAYGRTRDVFADFLRDSTRKFSRKTKSAIKHLPDFARPSSDLARVPVISPTSTLGDTNKLLNRTRTLKIRFYRKL